MTAIRRALTRQHDASTPVFAFVAAGGVTIVVSAVVHLYLWGKSDGYRAVPTIGPLFLIQAIVGCVLGPTMLLARRVIATAAGAIYMAMSIGALYLSMHGGLFGYQETLDAPYVKLSLVVEVIGLIATVVVGAMELRPRQVSSQ
jgi:hypothetical protein